MNNTNRNLSLRIGRTVSRVAAAGMLSLYFMPTAFAQAPAATTPATPNVFKTCSEQVKAAQTSGTQISRQDFHQQVKACVKPLKEAARSTCATEAGITALPTSRDGWKALPKDQRKAMHTCMAAKGFRHHRHHHHKKNQESAQTPAP